MKLRSWPDRPIARTTTDAARLSFVVARIARQSHDHSHLGHQIFEVEPRRSISQSGYLLPIGGNRRIPAAATGCDSRGDRSAAARRARGSAQTALGMPADLQRARPLPRHRGSYRRRAQSVPARLVAARQRLRLRTRRSDRHARPRYGAADRGQGRAAGQGGGGSGLGGLRANPSARQAIRCAAVSATSLS